MGGPFSFGHARDKRLRFHIMRVPTVSLKHKKTGQEIVINETRYRHPDGTIKEEWKDWEPKGFNSLTSVDIEANREEAAAKAREEAEAKRKREEADKALVDDTPLEGQELWDHIQALPTKGAVIAFAQSKGHNLDATEKRPDLNQACFDAMTAGEEGADIVDEDDDTARGENLPPEGQ